jgi:NAD+ synthase
VSKRISSEGLELQLTSSLFDSDWEEVETSVERFITDYVEKSKVKGIILGLSGGVDSSVAAALCAQAIGGDNVLGILLPEKETCNKDDIDQAKLVAKRFAINKEIADITSVVEAFYGSIPVFDPSDRLCKANIKARTRMIYVYYYANKRNLLVCGSSDKSETMMGYFTKWGDVAADIYPIMDLYKTQVRKLAEHLGIPQRIIDKPSTPALWPGQRAEKELGMKYEQLDLILYGLEHFMKTSEIARQLKQSEETILQVKRTWLRAEHKRRLLLTAKLEYRTAGTDFRLPRDPT